MGAQVERDHRREMNGDSIRYWNGRKGGSQCVRYPRSGDMCSSIGNAFQGNGKFAQVYIPVESFSIYLRFSTEYLIEYKAHVLALLIFGLTTVYYCFWWIVWRGADRRDSDGHSFHGDGSDRVIAYRNITPTILEAILPERFASVEEFASLQPVWRLEQFAGTELAIYHMFGAMTIAWVFKGMLLSAGGPAQLYDLQRYLAAKNPRDAAKIALFWPFFSPCVGSW